MQLMQVTTTLAFARLAVIRLRLLLCMASGVKRAKFVQALKQLEVGSRCIAQYWFMIVSTAW